jgi:ABC-type branched-subunit amino acid transport system permease subunit
MRGARRITTGSVYRTDFSLNMITHLPLGGMGTLIGPIIGSFLYGGADAGTARQAADRT